MVFGFNTDSGDDVSKKTFKDQEVVYVLEGEDSGLTQTVTSVTLSKTDAANISSTLTSSANNKQYVEFAMKEYTVKVDSTAMAAVANAAAGNDLKLVVETTAPAAEQSVLLKKLIDKN